MNSNVKKKKKQTKATRLVTLLDINDDVIQREG